MTDSVITHKSIAVVGLSRGLGRVRRLPWTLVLGSILLIIYLLVAITGPLWAPYRYDRVGTGKPFAAPNTNNLLGTDQMGRDLFSRVVYGAGHELFMALTSTAVAVILGGFLGLLSGFIGGWFDEIMMRVFEILISIPVLVPCPAGDYGGWAGSIRQRIVTGRRGSVGVPPTHRAYGAFGGN
jgi:ABC-type dipeptide/oligopeptide/nickel transport system permease subunit